MAPLRKKCVFPSMIHILTKRILLKYEFKTKLKPHGYYKPGKIFHSYTANPFSLKKWVLGRALHIKENPMIFRFFGLN
jgi:hypothetical protein